MSRRTVRLLGTIMLLLVSVIFTSTRAEALPAGWSTSTLSNGWVTVNDTTNNLNWLSPFYSTTISHDSMTVILTDPTSPYYGFRFATNPEVHQLFLAYGGTISTVSYSTSNYGPATNFINDFGFTGGTAGGPSLLTAGLTSTPYIPGTYFAPEVRLNMTTVNGRFTLTSFYGFQEDVYPNVGSWLVQPVPEPSTLLMLGTGLAGVGYARRRLKARS